jgi:tRNA G10  N-methylase Trm11
VITCVTGGLLASAAWAGCNVMSCEFHQKHFKVKPWSLTARVARAVWTLALPRGGHSMYKPSHTCVNGVILRGYYFGNHVFLVLYYYVIL